MFLFLFLFLKTFFLLSLGCVITEHKNSVHCYIEQWMQKLCAKFHHDSYGLQQMAATASGD